MNYNRLWMNYNNHRHLFIQIGMSSKIEESNKIYLYCDNNMIINFIMQKLEGKLGVNIWNHLRLKSVIILVGKTMVPLES